MKRTLVYLALLLVKLTYAQDIIVQTDGTTLTSVVQEVGSFEIKYKKFANKETSPLYSIPRYQVYRINYADGTTDIITPSAGSPSSSSTTGSSTVQSAFYLGAGATPYAPYHGADINTYWQQKFRAESAYSKGNIELNKGNATIYRLLIGGSIVNKQNNFSYEEQVDFSSSNALTNTASFDDGTNGTLALRYGSLNTLFQYTRGLDTSNRAQLGLETSLDCGLMSGKETDAFFTPGTYRSGTPQVTDYSGVSVGGHLGIVCKYFMGTKKNFGLEMQVGYRWMNIKPDSWDFSGTALNSSVNWGGAYVNLTALIQFNFKHTVSSYGYYNYGCGCYY